MDETPIKITEWRRLIACHFCSGKTGAIYMVIAMVPVSQHGPLRTILEGHCIDCHVHKIFKLIQRHFTREATVGMLYCHQIVLLPER